MPMLAESTFCTYIVSPRMTYTPMGTDFMGSVEENIRSWVSLRMTFMAWSYPRNVPYVIESTMFVSCLEYPIMHIVF